MSLVAGILKKISKIWEGSAKVWYSVWRNYIVLEHFRDAPTKKHLKNVYSSLSLSMFAAAVGSAVHMYTNFMKVHFTSGFLQRLYESVVSEPLLINYNNLWNHPPQRPIKYPSSERLVRLDFSW